jgi:enamine deaminase RidA (YjgF/YER057c/UK114 family)
LKNNFDSDAKEYLTLLAIQYKGNRDAILAAINNQERIVINRDLELFKLYQSDFRVITIFEDGYPEILKKSHKAPFALFYSGDLSLVDYAPQSIGVLGDDLEDAVVDSLVNTGNFVTMVGKEFLEITDGVANVFVSTTFGDDMPLLDKARLFSSLSKEVWLDGKEETALNLMVMLYAVKFDMRVVATNSSFIEDTAGDNVVVVDSFSDMLSI